MLTLRTHESIDEVAASAWDALAADDNPFVSHAFLAGLERTGCIRAAFGWRAQHLTLHDDDGTLLGAAPLYIKANSHGEYVFDWAWADAWERAGGDYYPKFLCAVPYSPVTGPRLLVGAGPDAAMRRHALATALRELTDRTGLSSLHVDFLRGEDTDAFDDAWLERSDWQFQWRNPGGWRDFRDYLDALTHKRRNAIRRERQQVADAGVTCEFRNGGSLDDDWRSMHHLYTHTFDEKGNTPTLTLAFFRHLGAAFPDHSHVAFARRGRDIIAGALFLSSRDTLYGRYWGARESVPGLHFELCYYQGIDYCLRAGLHRFEPGAQGLHKLARGFLPTRTHSRHYLADAGFRAAIRASLQREAVLLEARGRELLAHSPFAERSVAP